MLDRRDAELERLTSDVNILTEQLKAAVAAKCEAIAIADDVASKQIELELKEKRMESERSLLTQQNVDLMADLTRNAEEITKQRRESSAMILSLQTKLAEKDEEIRIGKEQITKILSTNSDLTKQLENLTEKLKEQCEMENKIVENFQQEVRAQAKLVDHYKMTADEAEAKSNELTSAVRELQRLLQEASSQYGDLETKLAQQETEHENNLAMRDKAISTLKEELKHANTLLEAVKQGKIYS
ncbi:hypothetical protein AAG570_011621 [Ranatra chinensis]|uniref:Nucleoprotein TPR/MPL1 domain-containing protein n=1 Tax=Ranatra chinensis TaxID=642074 RepID=A0ABD0YL69_9HEMI